MKKLIMLAAMIAVFGLGGAAAFAATSDKPPSPPGQDECEHGNSLKPCRDDPQPEKGKDCEEHGPFEGGVNEDHCLGETVPPPPDCPDGDLNGAEAGCGSFSECPNGDLNGAEEGCGSFSECPNGDLNGAETGCDKGGDDGGDTGGRDDDGTTKTTETTVVTVTESTPTETTPTETTSTEEAEPNVFTPPASQQPTQSHPVSKKLAQSQPASVAGAGAVARPSKAPQLAPFTP